MRVYMNDIRLYVRKIINADSSLYKACAYLLNFISVVRKEGIYTYYILNSLKDPSFNSGLPYCLSLNCLNHPIWIRPGSQDATHVINNVIRAEYGHFSPSQAPEYIIDAGAYIGDTATYFLSRFPTAKVIALEPNPDCFSTLNINLEPYGAKALILKKGLWTNEDVQFFTGSGTAASISSSGLRIECTTIPLLMNQFSIPRIDVLKIDVEGAEEAIFLSNPEKWLIYVNLIIIETHGPHIELLISRILKENNFNVKQYRSVLYCHNNKCKSLLLKCFITSLL